MPNTLQCSLVTPQRSVLDEEVAYASIPAWDGQIGIAPMRAPLLVKLGDGLLRLDLPGGASRWFFVGGGFAQVKDNRLTLLTDEAKAADDVDAAEAQAALDAAMALETPTTDQVEQKQRRIGRARSLQRLAGSK
ncbi:MAG: ATP synthase F1 subunit epsilon [Phycisphaeraceae bacterium]|nr:ATP synthase F1 subunit epsilon [Phycisphaeraceae bacterium]